MKPHTTLMNRSYTDHESQLWGMWGVDVKKFGEVDSFIGYME